MRSPIIVVTTVLLATSSALAQSPSLLVPSKPTQSSKTLQKTLPTKGVPSAKPCAAYGAGFVKLEGTDTCVHVGGAISIDAGTAIGGRR